MESSTEDFTNIVGRMDDIISKAEESSRSLHNVDESLSKLPPQMDTFSESIKSFDDVITYQRDQLSVTLNGLNNSISTFKSSIDSMIERFNRKPDIDIDLLNDLTDSTRIIFSIVITNKGNLLADIYMMRFAIDSAFVRSFVGAEKGDNVDNFANYQSDFQPPTPVYNVPRKFGCRIVLKNEDNLVLRINVYYRAAFGNDDMETQIFIFKKNKMSYIKLPKSN